MPSGSLSRTPVSRTPVRPGIRTGGGGAGDELAGGVVGTVVAGVVGAIVAAAAAGAGTGSGGTTFTTISRTPMTPRTASTLKGRDLGSASLGRTVEPSNASATSSQTAAEARKASTSMPPEPP
ncbi:hypothetical protein ACQP2X_34555 [Actinoplanes sp. CA-131856]